MHRVFYYWDCNYCSALSMTSAMMLLCGTGKPIA